MMKTQNKSYVIGLEEVNQAYAKKISRFLLWKTEWYELARTDHIANDIIINTERPIRAIILNGKEIKI